MRSDPEVPVATLTVWKFDTPEGADETESTLMSLSKQELIKIQDAATVSWPADRKKPKTRQLSNLTGAGASWGALWGLLFGLLFFIPLIGVAMGAGLGALAGHFTKVGIDEDFIDSVRSKVTPGTSALFLMSDEAVIDRIKEAFSSHNPELISTNLSAEQENELRKAFADE
jgi:uncharacterized membrane protein